MQEFTQEFQDYLSWCMRDQNMPVVLPEKYEIKQLEKLVMCQISYRIPRIPVLINEELYDLDQIYDQKNKQLLLLKDPLTGKAIELGDFKKPPRPMLDAIRDEITRINQESQAIVVQPEEQTKSKVFKNTVRSVAVKKKGFEVKVMMKNGDFVAQVEILKLSETKFKLLDHLRKPSVPAYDQLFKLIVLETLSISASFPSSLKLQIGAQNIQLSVKALASDAIQPNRIHNGYLFLCNLANSDSYSSIEACCQKLGGDNLGLVVAVSVLTEGGADRVVTDEMLKMLSEKYNLDVLQIESSDEKISHKNILGVLTMITAQMLAAINSELVPSPQQR